MKQSQLNVDAVFYGKMPFPKFWYDSNACWGNVTSIEELKEKCQLQIDPQFGALKTVDEFLDQSRQHDDYLSFGTRSEHRGDKTLRQFLLEHEVDISKL